MSRRSLTDAAIRAQVARARARAKQAQGTEPHAKEARFDKVRRSVHIELTNGAVLEVPVHLIAALQGASAQELADVEVGPAGVSVRWEPLDTDLSVAYLASTAFGPSLLLRAAGAAGGASRTPAKTRAARVNGKKGGRPRKALAGSAA